MSQSPVVSSHFAGRKPSAIRQAQILFQARPDKERIRCINLAIGNVSLPMHPAMQKRMRNLGETSSPFAQGVVMYSPTIGTDEARRAMLHVMSAAGLSTDGLHALITDGGSAAMELMVLGVAGPQSKRPIVLVDPIYTNYADMCRRAAVPFVAVPRRLGKDGTFSRPDLQTLANLCERDNPVALVLCPADNPTGQYLSQDDMRAFATLAARHNLWLVSDEAYRQLHYTGGKATSVWALSDKDVPGIVGRRLSIESSSKVWNACGLRIGGLVTDNLEFHQKAVAEYTANLSANAIGQWIFAALGEESPQALAAWYDEQRRYYIDMMQRLRDGLGAAIPGVVVTQPQAALYSVVDLGPVVGDDFDSADFVRFCAERGAVEVKGVPHTLLVAPMAGFYADPKAHGAKTQLRIAYVEPPEVTALVPGIFAELLKRYRAGG